jgi:hypothetical protein
MAARTSTASSDSARRPGAVPARSRQVGARAVAGIETAIPLPYPVSGLWRAAFGARHNWYDTRVKRNVNTGNPLVTQRNAKAYLAKVEKKLG